jgi:CRISPR-associated endonuclease/helicase Cas3
MLRRLREWLLPAVAGAEVDFEIVEWAVAGHHPAFNRQSPPNGINGAPGPEIRLLLAHADFRATLSFLKLTWNLGELPTIDDEGRSLVGTDTVFNELSRWSRASARAWGAMRNVPEGRLVAAVKAALIGSDVAGSAIAALEDQPRWTWISDAFMSKPQPGDLQSLIDFRLAGASPREFQRSVAASRAPVTFVKAGCGTGKTLGAYMWAAANYPTHRLYFCYPTTGTATEGFRDYLFDPGERTPRVGARLFHSRADVDFEIILRVDEDEAESESATRCDALEAWSTPIVSCTVDRVLGIMQNNRRGLFAWPALAQCAFVFDEIHAYDLRLFQALLRFLRDVSGVPVLLMTASLPADREAALRNIMKSQGRDWRPIEGPRELEDRPRYSKARLPDGDPLPAVRATLANGGRVLWVCNTVGRVMEAARRADELHPLIYHSRFKYEDRVERHAAVIDTFNGDAAALAICSQVAEMSLDLSADLLITDLAPVPAMIQRLGRLNRKPRAGDTTKPFAIVDPISSAPYVDARGEADPPGWPDAARQWLLALLDDDISQTQLADAWEQSAEDAPAPGESKWLDGGPKTEVVELRDGSAGITVMLERDLQRARANKQDMPRLLLPMPLPPRALNWRQWHRHRGVPVAPLGSISYDPMRGAEWQR